MSREGVHALYDEVQEIALGLKAGSHTAFKELMSQMYLKVWKTFRPLVRDDDTANDIAQESFLRVWRFRGTIDPTRQLKAWVMRIAFNVFKGQMAKEARFPATGVQPIDNDTAIDVSPDAKTILKEEIGKIRDLINDSFDDIEKVILWVWANAPNKSRWTDDLPVGFPLGPGAARTRLNRALETLRRKRGRQYVD